MPVLKVFTRLRTVLDQTGLHGCCKPEHRLITLTSESHSENLQFVFERVFPAAGSAGSQDTVALNACRPLVEHVLKGYHASLLVYGASESGKSYTVLGKQLSSTDADSLNQRGLLLRAADMFCKAAATSGGQLHVFLSMLEASGSQVTDLGNAPTLTTRLSSDSKGSKPGQSSQAAAWLASSRQQVSADAVAAAVSGQAPLLPGLALKEVHDVEDVASAVTNVMALLQQQQAGTAGKAVAKAGTYIYTLTLVNTQDRDSPVTSRLHFVELPPASSTPLPVAAVPPAASKTSHASSSNNNASKDLDMLEQTLLAVNKGGKMSVTSLQQCAAAAVIQEALQGNSMAALIATIHPTHNKYKDCVKTLQFAARCQCPDMEESNTSGGGPAASNMLFPAGSANSHIQNLQAQVESLQEELDYTHAHYQKLLEQVAGKDWAAQLGPLERAAADNLITTAAAAATAAVSRQSTHKRRGASFIVSKAAAAAAVHTEQQTGGPAAQKEVPGVARKSAPERVSSMAASDFALSRSPSMAASVMTIGGGTGKDSGFNASSALQKMKRLEMQLESVRSNLRESEDDAKRRRIEYEDFKDRMRQREQALAEDNKRLRDKISQLSEQVTETSMGSRHILDDAVRRHTDEVTRLTKDNELLRSQLASVNASLTSLVAARGVKADRDAKVHQHAMSDAQRQIATQVAVVAAEKDKQVVNIRQQSAHFLKTQAGELDKRTAELDTLKKQRQEEVTALQAEVQHLAVYAERVTQLLTRTVDMAASTSSATLSQDVGLLRSFRLPKNCKGPSLEPDKLQYLKSMGDLADKLLSTSLTLRDLPLDGSGLATLTICRSDGSLQHSPTQASLHSAEGSYSRSVGSKTEGTSSRFSTHTRAGSAAAGSHGAGTAQSVGLGGDIDGMRQDLDEAMNTPGVEAQLIDQKMQAYIEALECAVARYRSEVQGERQKQVHMNVALKSAQRAWARPNSGINQAISGASSIREQHWGYGHLGCSTDKRPATAAARLMGSSQGLAGLADKTFRPGTSSGSRTQTAMQMLTSAYRDQGLIMQ